MSSTKDEKPMSASRSRKPRNICLAVILGLIGVAIVMVILGFTVFKPKHAVTKVDSIGLKDVKVSLDVLRVSVHLNLTLDVDVSVKNPNRAGFKYGTGSALLKYRGETVGEASIPAGDISPGETIGVNLTLAILADRLLSNSNAYSDVASGTLPLNTYTVMSGRVYILKVIKHHLVSYTSCDLIIKVFNRTVSNSVCKYKSKL